MGGFKTLKNKTKNKENFRYLFFIVGNFGRASPRHFGLKTIVSKNTQNKHKTRLSRHNFYISCLLLHHSHPIHFIHHSSVLNSFFFLFLCKLSNYHHAPAFPHPSFFLAVYLILVSLSCKTYLPSTLQQSNFQSPAVVVELTCYSPPTGSSLLTFKTSSVKSCAVGNPNAQVKVQVGAV